MTRVPDSGREATHAEVLDQLGVAVVVTDAVGHVTSWNTRAAELYGWPVDEAVGRPLEELVGGAGKDAAAEEIVTPLRTGRRWQGMLRVRCRDGSLVTTFMRNSPLLDAAGNVIGVVTVSLEPGDPELAQAVQAASAGDGRGTRLLSPREREILGLLARGLTGEQIAERLVLSPETVRTHIRNAREKLGASTRVEAVTMALLAREINVSS